METDRIESSGPKTAETLPQSHQSSESEAFYDAPERLAEDDGGESDTPPDMDAKNSSHSASSISKPQNTRTPRIQRMSIKAANNPAIMKKTATLAFRKSGTKESIDRSTCSTVVGSTYGDSSQCHHPRRRQGSDLSAMSHCSEGSENRLHDKSEEGESVGAEGGEHVGSPRIRRISFPGKPKTGPSLPETEADSAGPEGKPQGSIQSDESVQEDEAGPSIQPAVSVSESQTSSSLSAPEELEDVQDVDTDADDNQCVEPDTQGKPTGTSSEKGDDDDGDSTNSSDDEIVCNFDDSDSEDLGSIQIVDSTMNLFSPGSEDGDSTTMQNRNKRRGRRPSSWHQRKREYFSPEFKRRCVQNFNTLRLICGKIVNNPTVQNIVVVLIIANALAMGLATFDFIDEYPNRKMAFERLDLAFLIAFTFESAFQLIFHGRNLTQDGWLTFDFLIVILSWCFSSMQVFRAIRTFRLVARVQILRKLIEALMEACPRLTGIMFLFLLIMYIYAVMITVLFGDMWEKGQTTKDYFSRLDTTLFTLFQMITLDWAKIVREIMEVYPLSWAVFSTYLSFTSFVLFSLVIGVVCDAVSAIEHDANLVEMLEQKEQAQERIVRLQHQVDYLKKQQKSVLASVQIVLDEIVAQERLRSNSGGDGHDSKFVLEKHVDLIKPESSDTKKSLRSSTNSKRG